MTKQHVNISIENDLVEKAKINRINMSEFFEHVLKERLNGDEQKYMSLIPNAEKIEKCAWCNKEGFRACRENDYKGMVILNPDERWICPLCLKIKTNSVIEGFDAGKSDSGAVEAK